MKKINNELWHAMLGYDPAPELKKMILTAVSDENITLEQACSRFAMPGPVVSLEPDGTFTHDGTTYTPQSWSQLHPCQTLIVLKVREN